MFLGTSTILSLIFSNVIKINQDECDSDEDCCCSDEDEEDQWHGDE